MTAEFSAVADDFFVNMDLLTTLPLPTGRESVLHFCEAATKEFADMTSFYCREQDQYVLEGDRESGIYKWLELQSHRLSAGYFNPRDTDDAHRFHEWLLDRSVYYLGVSYLDVECLDLMFGFNLDFQGNRDSIVAQALLRSSPLAALAAEESAKCIECEPSFVVALDDDCSLQARLAVEAHSSSYQVRTGRYDDEPISVCLTIRQYPRSGEVLDAKASLARQRELCEDICRRTVLPQVVRGIAAAIAASQ